MTMTIFKAHKRSIGYLVGKSLRATKLTRWMVVLKLKKKKKKTSIPNLLSFSEMTSGWNRYSVKNNTQFVLQPEVIFF